MPRSSRRGPRQWSTGWGRPPGDAGVVASVAATTSSCLRTEVQDDVDPRCTTRGASEKLDEFGIAMQVLYRTSSTSSSKRCCGARPELPTLAWCRPQRLLRSGAQPRRAGSSRSWPCRSGRRGLGQGEAPVRRPRPPRHPFRNAPEKRQPRMRDPHWDPIYATAQEMEIR